MPDDMTLKNTSLKVSQLLHSLYESSIVYYLSLHTVALSPPKGVLQALYTRGISKPFLVLSHGLVNFMIA